MTDFKQTTAPKTTITRDMNELTEKVGNVYETVAILGKRSNQISTAMKKELDAKLQDFSIPQDSADDTFENPLVSIIKEENKEIINKVFTTLSTREQQILRMRFGFEDNHPRTLEEIGAHYGLSRERIRQLEIKAMRKLRNPARAKMLKEAMA